MAAADITYLIGSANPSKQALLRTYAVRTLIP